MDSRTCAAVLVVEDEESLRKRVAESLESEGFQVYQAEGAAKALQILESMPRPALVLADLMTPSIDGPSLIAALGSADRFAILPVVLSVVNPSEGTHGKQPIDLGDLLRIVETLCFRRL